MTRSVLVFCGGNAPSSAVVSRAQPWDISVAADSGLDLALAHGFMPDVLVGDMDSVSADGLAKATEAGIEIDRHDVAKDETDFELAISRAQAEPEVTEIKAVAIDGGRVDHYLANLAALADPALSGAQVVAYTEHQITYVVHDDLAFDGTPGQLVSLVPFGPNVTGVTTEGLEYALQDDILHTYGSRGVSNVMTSGRATVKIKSGCLLVIQTLGSFDE